MTTKYFLETVLTKYRKSHTTVSYVVWHSSCHSVGVEFGWVLKEEKGVGTTWAAAAFIYDNGSGIGYLKLFFLPAK